MSCEQLLRIGGHIGFDHPWLPRLAYRDQSEQIRFLLLVAEDHSYSFKTTYQRYDSAKDGVPYGP
jgi:hypothetical protein